MDQRLAQVTDDRLDGLLRKYPVVVVYCYRAGDGIDREERMVRLGRPGQLLSAAHVVKIDLDNNPVTTRQYRPQSSPTLLVFSGGNLVVKTPFRSTGQHKCAITQRLHKALAK